MPDTNNVTKELEVLRPGQYTINKVNKVLGISPSDIDPESSTQAFYEKLWGGLCSNKDAIQDSLREKYNIETTIKTTDTFRERFIKLFEEHEREAAYENSYIKKSEEMINNLQIQKEPNEPNDQLNFMKEPIKRNIINVWLYNNVKPSDWRSRLTLYKLSFAYDLTWEKHTELFLKVCRSKLYWRAPEELCLTYCKKNKKTYKDAVNMYINYLNNTTASVQDSTPSDVDLSKKSTRTAFDAALSKDEDEFIAALSNLSLEVTAETINKETIELIAETLKKKISVENKKRVVYINNFLTNKKYCLYPSKEEIDLPDVFVINFESDAKGKGNYKDILRKRKKYIICKFYNTFFSYSTDEDKFILKEQPNDNKGRRECFISFIGSLNKKLILMNLPVMDYLDDFDRGIILAAAYVIITNDDRTLSGILCDIV